MPRPIIGTNSRYWLLMWAKMFSPAAAQQAGDVHPLGPVPAGQADQPERQRDPETGEERLGEDALGQLRVVQLVGQQRPVGLHRGVVAGIQQPQQQHGHPQRGHEREQEQEQSDAAADRAGDEERLAAPPTGRSRSCRSSPR
jgi:hypothetical protein